MQFYLTSPSGEEHKTFYPSSEEYRTSYLPSEEYRTSYLPSEKHNELYELRSKIGEIARKNCFRGIVPNSLIIGWYTLSSKLAEWLKPKLLVALPSLTEEEESPYPKLRNNYFNLSNKFICSLPLIGSFPNEESQKPLREAITMNLNVNFQPPTLRENGFLEFPPSNFHQLIQNKCTIAQMIDLKNEYKICSIARAVLTAAMTVSIVALTVFALGAPSVITTATAYAATTAAVAATAHQRRDIWENIDIKNQFLGEHEFVLHSIR